MRPRIKITIVCLLLALAAFAMAEARGRPLALRHVGLDLPGPPAKVIATDLNGDGRSDLLVVVVYTEIEEIYEDRVENLVSITTVIPAAFDRREVRVYLSDETGELIPAGAPLELPRSVLHLEPGPPGTGILALTDDGMSRLTLERGSGALRLVPLLSDPPVLAGTGNFFPRLNLVHDLNGDGIDDVLLPSRDALAVYLADGSGLADSPADRIELPRAAHIRGGYLHRRWYPLPEVVEIDGDGHPDLLFWEGFSDELRTQKHILLGSGDGKFRPLRDQALDCHDESTDLRQAVAEAGDWPWPQDLAALRDIDGDGRAEAVIQVEKPRGDSFRKGMKDAKKPIYEFGFHELNDDLAVASTPYLTMTATGHSWETGPENDLALRSEQFQDLDGDGRLDLVTMTLDFSIFQALRVMATKRLSIGIDFHVYAQQEDGTFREVPDLDLSEKLKFDLDNLELGRFGQFAGDFDGDGRQDFVHLGRGKTVTIHTGQPGCRYPKKPDLAIALDEEPASLDLVHIEDLDGDGRADLRITRPLPLTDVDATAPVRLDLYLSGGGT